MMGPDQIAIFTPLGIRFWDPVTGRAVTSGLVVTARPESAPSLVVKGERTPSGVYAFFKLPTMHDLSYIKINQDPNADPDDEPLIPDVPPKRVIFAVSDTEERFLPVAFSLELPLPYRGVYPSAAPTSPPGNASRGFFLSSSTTRTPPTGTAVIRAQVVRQSTGKPAAHAVAVVNVAGKEWYGIADLKGRILLLLPYPVFSTPILQSLPGQEPNPVNQQRWPITIRIHYAPDDLVTLADLETPDLLSILNQAEASLWTDDTSSVTLWNRELGFGKTLTLRTGNRSVLWIDALP